MESEIIYARFERERETKNTVRFAEVGTGHIGTLYIRKEALEASGLTDATVIEIAIRQAN